MSLTTVARPTRAAMNDLTAKRDPVVAERDSVVAECDRIQGLLETRGIQLAQMSENLGTVTEELVKTRRRATLREDQVNHQRQLNH